MMMFLFMVDIVVVVQVMMVGLWIKFDALILMESLSLTFDGGSK
jgi:hypothetical protein